jgi:hypothetical protein
MSCRCQRSRVAGVTKNADQRGRGEQSRQGSQHHPVGRLQVGAVHLAAEHRHLVAQHEEFDVLGSAVSGELGQHLQNLAQQQVHQRRAHGLHRVGYVDVEHA